MGVVTTGKCVNHDYNTFICVPVLKTQGYNNARYYDRDYGSFIIPLK
jgi:hypothetical protein